MPQFNVSTLFYFKISTTINVKQDCVGARRQVQHNLVKCTCTILDFAFQKRFTAQYQGSKKKNQQAYKL